MKELHNKWLPYTILLSGPLLSVIDVFIVNIAIPSIKNSLHTNDGQAELVIASYLLGYASFQITAGRTGDIYGRKKIFFWGMFFFVISSLFCGLAVNVEMLIAARFIQGVSGAFMTPQSLAYLQILFPDSKERTKAVGFLGITLGLASILGQFLGGYFSELTSVIEGWRFIFFINIPVGILALWATKKYLINTKQNANEKLDYEGVLLLTLFLGSLIFPLTIGREQGWPLWSILLLFLSMILIGILYKNQKNKLAKNRHRLIDLRLFKIKDFNIGILVVTFYFMVHTSYLLTSTIYLQKGLHYTPLQTGMCFVYSGFFFIISSFLSIRLVNKYGKLPILIGTLLLAFGYILQAYFFNSEVSNLQVQLILLIWGIAGGIVLPSLINITLKKIPMEFIGVASGVYNTIQQAASSLGICIIGGFFFSKIQFSGNLTEAFHYSLYINILCLFVVFFLLNIMEDIRR